MKRHILRYIAGLLLIYLAVSVGGNPYRAIIIALIGLLILFGAVGDAEKRMEK